MSGKFLVPPLSSQEKGGTLVFQPAEAQKKQMYNPPTEKPVGTI